MLVQVGDRVLMVPKGMLPFCTWSEKRLKVQGGAQPEQLWRAHQVAQGREFVSGGGPQRCTGGVLVMGSPPA